MKHALLAATALLGFTVPFAAHSAVILTFGQTAGTPISATENAAHTQTTLSATDAAISITQIQNGAPAAAFFDLSATSVGPAQVIGNGAAQHFAGSFSINSLANNTGTNYLSGTFSDLLFGAGQGAALASGAPPDTISFSSSVITSLANPAAIALAFANVVPDFHIDNTTIAAFTSSVSGTFSANAAAAPEPMGLAVLGVGLLGLGMVRATRRS